MSTSPSYFDAMFDASDDPWRFKSRWYEARKRALTLACLPAQRYARAFEPGCAIGELSAALAERCDHLLATDGSSRALALARQRLADSPQVELRQAWLPQDWPTGHFNLIVISELGYFLDSDALDTLAAQARAALEPGGTVLACHWRRPIEGCSLDGDAVHRLLAERLGLPTLVQVQDDDLRLDVWSDDPRSIAQREGFV